MNDSIFELTIQRIMDEAKTGVNAGALSSFFKYGLEQNVSRMELMTAITGSDGLVWEGEDEEAEIKLDCFVVPKIPLKEGLRDSIENHCETYLKLTS